MSRGRMPDADAATQEDGHVEPAARHVLHFGDLVDDFAGGIKDKVGEHEIDDGPGVSHGGAAAEADEAAFADGSIAQAQRAVKIVEAGGGFEVATALANTLPKN